MEKKSKLKLDELPAMEVVDAAWAVGIAHEAMGQFLSENNLIRDQGVTVIELLQTAFHLLGYKQTQVDLLTRQLQTALSREQELVSALQSQLGTPATRPEKSADALQVRSSPGKHVFDDVEPAREKKKKGGKKKKREAFFP